MAEVSQGLVYWFDPQISFVFAAKTVSDEPTRMKSVHTFVQKTVCLESKSARMSPMHDWCRKKLGEHKKQGSPRRVL